MTEEQDRKTRRTRYEDVISLARRRGILYPSYEIYGGVAGFYDWGPVGTLIKNNFLELWRRVYVEGEGFLEIDCPNVSPEEVFEASGHLDEFADLMVECTECGRHFRADHLAEGLHPNPDALPGEELTKILRRADVVCPDCGEDLGDPYSFNLMFETSIGPSSDRTGYLRPETAQGMFLNFRNLFIHNRQKLPLGVVQIGKGFRNEISPRQGVIRVREFNMAELELFVEPDDTSFDKFPLMKDMTVKLLPDEPEKRTVEKTIGEAVSQGVLTNEILAYYIGLTQHILINTGLHSDKLRFRQHEKDEMAHYAKDCWDAEALLDFGWVELVGIADRSCYDVEQHMKYSGVDLRATRQLDEAKEVHVERLEPVMSELGPAFKNDAPKVARALLDTEVPGEPGGNLELEIDGNAVTVTPEMYELVERTEKRTVEKFVPRVIEPSYGVDRILYSALEHSLERVVDEEGEETRIMRLPSRIAPYQYAVFPLMSKDELSDHARSLFEDLKGKLRGRGYMGYYDESGSIGRRYSRMDEIGTPFCMTVDYRTLEDDTFTIRDRDTKDQTRMDIGKVDVLIPLIEGEITLKEWARENGAELIIRDEEE